MSAAGVPVQYGSQLVEIADGLLMKFGEASKEQIDLHGARIGNQLREQWGEDYDSRVEAVNNLLADIAEKYPLIGNLLDNAPYVFADVWTMISLWNVAEHRNSHA
jgi:hypothetical protein